MKKKCLLILFILINLFPAYSQLDTTMWETNSSVYGFAEGGGTLFIGGNFTMVGPSTGAAVPLTPENGIIAGLEDKISGYVNAIIPDENNGWYIGGSFIIGSGGFMHSFAHIDQFGKISGWYPTLNGSVYSIVKNGNTIYLGGSFTNVNGVSKSGLVAFNVITGTMISGTPDILGGLYALAIAGDTLYVGGNFSSVGGNARTHLAGISMSTNTVTSFNPSVSNEVRSMLVYGQQLYVGGLFTTVEGQTRNRVASFNIPTRTLTNWNPNAGSSVRKMIGLRNKIYLAGTFSNMGGVSRSRAAAVDTINGSLQTWGPVFNNSVYDITLYKDAIYAAGAFTIAGGQERFRLAAVDTVTGTLRGWKPIASDEALSICASGTRIMVGGGFNSVNGVFRNKLASIDISTGKATGWNPTVDNIVNTVNVKNNILYVGGYFNNINGQPRNKLAAIDLISGDVSGSFNVSVTGLYVNYIFATDTVIYIGGNFTAVNGIARTNLAAIYPDGTLSPWAPNPNALVRQFTIDGNTMYLTGNFTSVGGQARNYVAAVDLTTGLATSWNPNPNALTWGVSVKNSKAYLCGDFTSIGGQTRNRLACVDKISGVVTSWNPNSNGQVTDVAFYVDRIFATGSMSTVGGTTSGSVVQLDTLSGNRLSGPLFTGGAGGTFHVAGDRMYMGIPFQKIEGYPKRNLAAYGQRPLLTNKIKGKVFIDPNLNCTRESNEKLASGYVVVANPGPYFASTDQNGNYELVVDNGSYTISHYLPLNVKKKGKVVCPSSNYNVNFSTSGNEVSNYDFADTLINCSLLQVDYSSPRKRRCFRNYAVVSYSNNGTLDVSNVIVKIEYDRYTVPVSSDIPWLEKTDSTLVFDIGTLPAGQAGRIVIYDSVRCVPGITGLTQCTKVSIFPKENCNLSDPSWDKSSVKVTGNCINGIAVFIIKNGGSGDMTGAHPYRIYFDNVLGYESTFQLNSGDSIVVNVNANGQTVRLEADQHPLHPGKSRPRKTIEGCGGAIATASRGFVQSVTEDDAVADFEEDCRIIRDSYDPNQKTGLPSGITYNHYIPDGEELEYLIEFQNTGSDTAYKVVLIDTLDTNLDIENFEFTLASHLCNWEISGMGSPVLTFTFNNINLPDSSVNKSGSNGFVLFKIQAKSGLAKGTILKNKAYIYFDYNEPVLTNETEHVIYDTTIVDLSKSTLVSVGGTTNLTKASPVENFIIIPNPVKNKEWIHVYTEMETGTYSVVNLNGSCLLSGTFENDFLLNSNQLPAGFYIVYLESKTGIVSYSKLIVQPW